MTYKPIQCGPMSDLPKAVSEYMSSIGSKGGKGNSSKAQAQKSKDRWSGVSKSKRADQMRLNRYKGMARKKLESQSLKDPSEAAVEKLAHKLIADKAAIEAEKEKRRQARAARKAAKAKKG